VSPWHGKAPVTHLVMAKGSLQGRGTWVGGQHCLLVPDLGRTPCHGPWPGMHHPLPCMTHWEQSPTPHTPCPAPQPPQSAQPHAPTTQMGQVEENWPQGTAGTHQDGPSQVHPTTTVHAFPTVGVTTGPHRVSRPGFQDLFLGRACLEAEEEVHLVSSAHLAPGHRGSAE